MKLESGSIVEIEQLLEPMVETPHIFTKLQIRRAMRKLGEEDKLDEILSSDFTIQKDWQDAQEIDLNDPIFASALETAGIESDFVVRITNAIEEQ